MIWTIILRSGTVLALATAMWDVYDRLLREVAPHRIYSSTEVARYLGVDRNQVIDLIRNKQLQAKLLNGNYRIPGQSVLEFLNK
ncbi:MAG: helix-turn-helix domain-containing protein [Alphaproteobacteria bacterium]